MVARLTAEVTGSNTILHDEDPVAIEAADDRPAGAWAKATVGDTRLVLKHFTQGRLRIANQFEGIKRRHRVEGFEGGRRRPDRPAVTCRSSDDGTV